MKRHSFSSISILLFLVTLSVPAQESQQPAAIQQRTAPGSDQGIVELDFGDEIELRGFVDYVSRRLGVNFLYDEEILSKKVTIRAPGRIPTSSLMGILQSALKMKDLSVIDAEPAGWKRIVSAGRLAQVAIPGDAAQVIRDQGDFGAASAITQVFVLRYADATQVDQLIKPFLTLPAANSIGVREAGVLIVTDFAANLVRIAKLVELIDRPKPEVVVEFMRLTHVQAKDVAKQISDMLLAQPQTVDPTGSGRGPWSPAVAVGHDERTNQLVIIGLPQHVQRVRELVHAFDVPQEVTTEIYATQHVSAERLDRVIQDLVQPTAAKRVFMSAVDAQANLLFVTTTPEFHQQIQVVRQRLDVPTAAAQPPIRFYKLQHVTALELLQTLRAIEGESAGPSSRYGAGSDSGRSGLQRSLRDRRSSQNQDGSGSFSGSSNNMLNYNVRQAGPNRPPPAPGEELPLPPAYQPDIGSDSQLNPQGSISLSQLRPGQARVTADEASNTIIVIADPAVQQVYAELIRALDQRRPQVLIEARLVVINTSDDFSLGVEISGGDRIGLKKLFAFSSFGLSTVDPVTGSLAIIPGTGFNGTLVDPTVADAVLRALSNHRRARILSAPRVLVNDNSEGILASVAEVPFTSVNASQTVATTSFAGFAEAGTSIVVRPHIGAQDHLQLEFAVTMNSFTTDVDTPGIPPARQTEEVESEITIPDGHTVIVGGLNRKGNLNNTNGIPYLENIPVLRFLAGTFTNNDDSMSLFVFIRPIILRDDKFKDLKFLSERDIDQIGVPGRYPASQPLSLR